MNDTLPPTSSASPTPADSPADTGTDQLRDLLARVAAGEVAPDEAARLLDQDPTVPTVDQVTLDARPGSDAPVTALVLRAGGVKLTVVADPTVDTLVADGPHALRREGASLVLEAPGTDGYQTQPAPRFLGWVPTVWTGGRGEKVTVRVNPSLPITVDATACSVEIVGLTGDLTLAGSASSIKVRDHRGTVHGSLSMGSLAIVGVITGPSSLHYELGSVNVRLERGSDVTVSGTAEMGSVKVAGSSAPTPTEGGMRQVVTAGSGAHPFDILVRMGSLTVVAA